MVQEVREHLSKSPLAPALARDAAHRVGLDGEARLVVGDDGTLFSQVEEPQPAQQFDGQGRALPVWVEDPTVPKAPPVDKPPVVVVPRPPRPSEPGEGKRIWTTHLPSLEELRVEARALGIDVEAFGRKKVELAEAVRATKAGEPIVLPPPEPKSGKLATAAAVAEDLDLDGILRPPSRRSRT